MIASIYNSKGSCYFSKSAKGKHRNVFKLDFQGTCTATRDDMLESRNVIESPVPIHLDDYYVFNYNLYKYIQTTFLNCVHKIVNLVYLHRTPCAPTCFPKFVFFTLEKCLCGSL